MGKCENFAMVKEDFSDYTAEEKRERKVYISYENRESDQSNGFTCGSGSSGKYTHSQDTKHFIEKLLNFFLYSIFSLHS